MNPCMKLGDGVGAISALGGMGIPKSESDGMTAPATWPGVGAWLPPVNKLATPCPIFESPVDCPTCPNASPMPPMVYPLEYLTPLARRCGNRPSRFEHLQARRDA